MRKRKYCTILAFVFLIAVFYISNIRQKFVLPPLPTLLPEIQSYLDSLKRVDANCSEVVYGNYCIHSLQGNAQRSNISLGPVTLCTQSTVGFLQHVSVLCKRWGGPISVAVYSPPLDYPDARDTVDALRHCDFCIRHWVSWHFFAEMTKGDFTGGSGIPSRNDSQNPWDCEFVLRGIGNTERSGGTYPINVARNIARKKAQTPYIFSLDIELYPSSGVLQKFERMLRSSNITLGDPQVWVLPVFEVYSNVSAPSTKFHLREMFYRKRAVSFHKFRCNMCHLIPNLTHWLNHNAHRKPEAEESVEELKVLMTVKRIPKFRLQNWEPFFIGTNQEPEFDIQLTWEGKRNKMQMAYEMCLRNYSYHIVDNAFLVHAPGVNFYNRDKESKRTKYTHVNNRRLAFIKKVLIKKYGKNTDCRIRY